MLKSKYGDSNQSIWPTRFWIDIFSPTHPALERGVHCWFRATWDRHFRSRPLKEWMICLVCFIVTIVFNSNFTTNNLKMEIICKRGTRQRVPETASNLSALLRIHDIARSVRCFYRVNFDAFYSIQEWAKRKKHLQAFPLSQTREERSFVFPLLNTRLVSRPRRAGGSAGGRQLETQAYLACFLNSPVMVHWNVEHRHFDHLDEKHNTPHSAYCDIFISDRQFGCEFRAHFSATSDLYFHILRAWYDPQTLKKSGSIAIVPAKKIGENMRYCYQSSGLRTKKNKRAI